MLASPNSPDCSSNIYFIDNIRYVKLYRYSGFFRPEGVAER
ncbi:UNVERIFIED_ORG: hypothetical protein QOE_1649 [Clostridioides difficile F501]